MSSAGGIQIPIEKDFYEKVERKNYLKHILYGDSVVGDSLTHVLFHSEQMEISFSGIWEKLAAELEIEKIDDKEYIFLPQNSDILKIQTPDLKNDQIVWVTPKYLMRHMYRGTIYNNYTTNDKMISTTMNHSFVDLNMRTMTFEKKNPVEIMVVPILGSCPLRIPQKYSLFYGLETKYDYLGVVRNSRANKQLLTCLRPWKLCRKNKTSDFEGYVYDFEVPDTHVFFANNVLVHNTDSLFLEIPKRPDDAKGKIRLVNETASTINNLIVDYNKSYLMPRCGYSPDRNETKFKEEIRSFL